MAGAQTGDEGEVVGMGEAEVSSVPLRLQTLLVTPKLQPHTPSSMTIHLRTGLALFCLPIGHMAHACPAQG